jgi:excisionase family DNA binding protein
VTDTAEPIGRISYSIEEAAEALGIDRHRLGGLVRLGRVPHLMLGSRVLIGKAALEQWLTRECMAAVNAASDSDIGKLPVAPVRRIRIGTRATGHASDFVS